MVISIAYSLETWRIIIRGLAAGCYQTAHM
jgi:hypothetical protein